MGTSERLPRRRIGSILIAVLVIAGFLAVLNSGLLSCSSGVPAGPRALTEAELDRLATMRMHNFADGRTGLRGTIGPPARRSTVNGWVDWNRSLIYLSVDSTQTGSALVQATPATLAVRPGPIPQPAASRAEATHTPAPAASTASSQATSSAGSAVPGQPPAEPPADGWRIRPIDLTPDDEAPLDNLISFLFLLAREQPDRVDLLASLENQWVRHDTTQDIKVDVLLGPAVLPVSEAREPSPVPVPSGSASSTAAAFDPAALDTYGGAVGYWLDAQARLRRVETLLGTDLPATLDLIREDRRHFMAVPALGGRDNEPRQATEAEAALLAAMRQRNLLAGGGTITVTMPVLPGALRMGTGWLDWRKRVAYLSVRDVDDAGYDVVLHANRNTISLHPPGAGADGAPPLPAPRGNWEQAEWTDVSGTPQLTDLDLLLHEALSLGLDQRDDAGELRQVARRLRVDLLDGDPVGVFELPSPVEQQLPGGAARMRYWVDNSGVLRRLEVRTVTGGFAQLDIGYHSELPGLPDRVS